MIKVLIVEDSAVVREFLVHVLGSDPEIRVVGTARDGEEALEAAARERPDVITMDIHMPRLDGLEATRRIMETTPTPIVVVSGSTDAGEVATTFRAMEAGALAVVPRPAGLGHSDHDATARELVQTVKLMSEVKVVRRWGRRPEAPARPGPAVARHPGIRLVAVGASTGGPPVLQVILSALPADFPVPVAIVQHMATGFLEGFVEWLGQASGRPVRLAATGDVLRPGEVVVAPDGAQMKVERGGRVALTGDDPEHGMRPSVSYLFRSVAEAYGSSAVGVLLTGMGRDGAEELRLLRERGAVTLVQDEATSVVHGMPGEAIRLGAADHVLSPEKIAAALVGLVNHHEGKDERG